jgi:serine/threonine protein phosphatase PrpC
VSIVLLASALASRGDSRVERLDERAAAALHTGGGSWLNGKSWSCEDSLAVHRLGDGEYLALVADAHFGGSSSEAMARDLLDAWNAAGDQPVLTRLYRSVLDLEERFHDAVHRDDRSETTLLAVHLAGRTLSYLNVGDSLLFVVGARGWRLLNRRAPHFVGQRLLLEAPASVEECATVEITAGDVVLLATDGLETQASAMQPDELPEILCAAAPVEERVRRLAERAAGGTRGGGRDNLALIAIEAR